MILDVRHKCGHVSTQECIQRWQPDYYAKKLCRACQRVFDEAEAERLGLPALVGTDKQIPWANSVRVKLAVRANTAALSRLRLANSAAWWIEHRDDKLDAVLADLKNGVVIADRESVHDLVPSWDRGRA